MATIQEHLGQWQHNRKFIATIDPEFPDWMVTVTFYAAMHLVEALLTADGAKDRSRHQDRFQILQHEQRYQKVYESYHVLYDLAHVTRYTATPARWISIERIKSEVIEKLLYPIEKSVRKLLATHKPPVAMSEHAPILLGRNVPPITATADKPLE